MLGAVIFFELALNNKSGKCGSITYLDDTRCQSRQSSFHTEETVWLFEYVTMSSMSKFMVWAKADPFHLVPIRVLICHQCKIKSLLIGFDTLIATLPDAPTHLPNQ
jgi:hypothetical protein